MPPVWHAPEREMIPRCLFLRRECANIEVIERNGRHSEASDKSRAPYYRRRYRRRQCAIGGAIGARFRVASRQINAPYIIGRSHVLITRRDETHPFGSLRPAPRSGLAAGDSAKNNSAVATNSER